MIVFGYLRVYNSSSWLPLTGSARGTDLLLDLRLRDAGAAVYVPGGRHWLAHDRRAHADGGRREPRRSWPTILFRVIFPNVRSAILSGAFLTFAIVIGEFTFASLLNRPAFGPYLQLIGANRAYEPSALAIIAFCVTWACMGLSPVRSGAARAMAAAVERGQRCFWNSKTVRKQLRREHCRPRLQPVGRARASSFHSSDPPAAARRRRCA